MDFANFPPVDKPEERLAAYREEKRRVEEALKKQPEQRTKQDRNWIAYSEHGTAARCHH